MLSCCSTQSTICRIVLDDASAAAAAAAAKWWLVQQVWCNAVSRGKGVLLGSSGSVWYGCEAGSGAMVFQT
jgi:hypothetical protein